MLTFLEKLVTFESPTGAPSAQTPVLNSLAQVLSDIGYDVAIDSIEGHPLLVGGNAAPSEKYQMVVGHSDTVWSMGTLKNMPFRIAGRRAHGPGIFDMKAGLAQGIFALEAIHRLGIDLDLPVVFVVNSDEEQGSTHSRRTIERLARRANRAFILEPALGDVGRLKTSRKGGAGYTIEIKGREAHAGLEPGRGASAIQALAEIVQHLFDLNDPERGISVNVGQIGGGTLPNVVAPRAMARVDVRAPDPDDLVRLDAAIRTLRPAVPGTEVSVWSPGIRLPLERTPPVERLWHKATESARELGATLDEGAAGGMSDGNTIAAFAPTLDGLGAVGDGAHARHEFIYTDKMVERAALLALLLSSPAEDA